MPRAIRTAFRQSEHCVFAVAVGLVGRHAVHRRRRPVTGTGHATGFEATQFSKQMPSFDGITGMATADGMQEGFLC